MPRVRRFAPVSAAPSALISVASFYFILSAVLAALVTVLIPTFSLDARAGVTPTGMAVSIALGLAWAAAYFWTGVLLGRASRRGAYWALGLILLALLGKPSGTSLAIAMVSITVLASIWRDLK